MFVCTFPTYLEEDEIRELLAPVWCLEANLLDSDFSGLGVTHCGVQLEDSFYPRQVRFASDEAWKVSAFIRLLPKAERYFNYNPEKLVVPYANIRVNRMDLKAYVGYVAQLQSGIVEVIAGLRKMPRSAQAAKLRIKLQELLDIGVNNSKMT